MPESKSVREKVARLRSGGQPRLLDLFAGCGGISLGFHRAGFRIAGAIESDPWAAQSHGANFFRSASEEERALHSQAVDITLTEPSAYVKRLGHDDGAEAAFDVIVGGPPCQAFARVGRAKLREVAEHPTAFRLDPRGNLYLRYLEFVRQLRPVAILMENVPDVLNYAGHNVAEEICETLDDLGFECRYTLLNAVHYGVPEMRERMFLFAVHRDAGGEPVIPAATHRYRLPQGYAGSRMVALKTIREDLFDGDHYYVEPPAPAAEAAEAVTAAEALGDLPRITAHLEGRLPRGARRFTEHIPYPDDVPLSGYAQGMRNWPGFEANGGLADHVIRSLPRDYPIFRRMRPGDEYPEAHAHALALFEEELARAGGGLSRRSKAYQDLRKRVVPPYDPGKFPNKWRKMAADEPARTLMAHLGKDSYSHVHYDSEQARTISVREAARLQSFPDGFVFRGTMNPAFRQIGNAVPPLLAYRLALAMRQSLGIAQ
jgi:DNA (cytosine-5)-methyltransferase 1